MPVQDHSHTFELPTVPDWVDAGWTIGFDFTEGNAVLHNGSSYQVFEDQGHTSTAADEPGVGVNWTTYWRIIASKGTNGLSAYDEWLAQGNSGSEADFFNSTNGDILDEAEVVKPENAPVSSVNGKTGPVTVTKKDVELENVANVKPQDMPTSIAQRAAFVSKDYGNAPRVGQLATRCYLTPKSGTSATHVNARSGHVAKTRMKTFKIVYGNYRNLYTASMYQDFATPFSDDATYSASIEYPLGVFTRVKFAGVDTGTVVSLGTLISDDITLSIPKGKTFWVWTHRAGISNFLYEEHPGVKLLSSDTVGFRDAYENGTGLADKSDGATPIVSTATTDKYYLSPIAMIGETREPNILILGDGHARGTGEHAVVASGNTGLGRFIGDLAHINAGVTGMKLQGLADDAGVTPAAYKRRELGEYPTAVLLSAGIYDLIAGRTPTEAKDDAETFAALHKAAYPSVKLFICTIPPHMTDVTNTAQATTNANRLLLNAEIRAGLVGFDDIFDIADNETDASTAGTETRDGGFLPEPTWLSTATAATAGLDLSDVGYDGIASSLYATTDVLDLV